MSHLPPQPKVSLPSDAEDTTASEGDEAHSQFSDSLSLAQDSQTKALSKGLAAIASRFRSAPSWPYVRPLWLLSLGLHIGALLIPVGTKEPAKLPIAAKSVKVTKIAVPNQPKSIKKRRLTVPPKPKPILRVAAPIIPSTRPKIKALAPSSVAKVSPSPAPTPQEDADNTGLDLPLYPNAQEGCNGACLQTPDALDKVAAFFTAALPKQKWKSEQTENTAARKVLRISKGNVTQYLSIIATDNPKGTAYVAADQPKTQEDLKSSVAVPQEVAEILSNVSAQDVDASATAQPALFSKRPKILSMSFLEGETPDTVFDTFFSTNLRNNNYEFSASTTTYGGGPVYEIKRDKFKAYINLVPDKDGKGTVIVIWEAPPS
jgi:hypothetical protein